MIYIILCHVVSILATPISSPGCEYAFGIYPDSAECSTTYLKCAYGEPSQHHCDAGLAYDERIHGCNWPDQLLHICNPEGKLILLLGQIEENAHCLSFVSSNSCRWLHLPNQS